MSNLNMLEFIRKISDIYDKVPKQYQKHRGELDKALNNILNEYNVVADLEAETHNKLEKTTKAYEDLKWEYDELDKEYEKLNKKLNNDLIAP